MITYAPSVIAAAMLQATALSSAFEGLMLRAYPDPGTGAEPWTIGRGTTMIYGRPVRPGDTCTMEQADEWQQDDLRGSMQIVINALAVELNANQLGALASFVNNIGPGKPSEKDGFIWLANGEHSTLFKCLEANDLAGAAAQIPLWDRGGGRRLGGLDRRRTAEVKVFTTMPVAPA
jgi:lysozyme